MSKTKKTVCVDFDGVLHSYTSGWKGLEVADDPPVEGAIEFLRKLLKDEDVHLCIYSARSHRGAGVRAMRRWLLEHGMTRAEVNLIGFPLKKPSAHLTIDDRAMCFQGRFPSLDQIKGFTPWNRKRHGQVQRP